MYDLYKNIQFHDKSINKNHKNNKKNKASYKKMLYC